MKRSFIAALFLSGFPYLLNSAPSIAITDFDNSYDTQVNAIIPNVLSETLLNSGKFELFERDQLYALIREQDLQTSGLIDPATAVTLGKLSGLDYLLTGEIIDFGREVRAYSGYGVQTETVFYRLEASVRILDTETGQVVFSKTERAEERQNQGAGTRISDTSIDTRLGRLVAERLGTAILAAPVFKEKKDQPELAALHISSSPEKASVEIDGVFYGNTGNPFKVPAGLHRIRVTLPGYEVWDKQVMVHDGIRFHVPLVRKADVRVEVEENRTIHQESAD